MSNRPPAALVPCPAAVDLAAQLGEAAQDVVVALGEGAGDPRGVNRRRALAQIVTAGG